MLYTADFETTTDVNDCRVWATGICEISETYNFHYGSSIEFLFDFMEEHIGDTFYFHNLAFDGTFIMCYLFEHGYKHIIDNKDNKKKTFTTLISDKGQFYAIEIYFARNKSVKILDSLKLLPFTVDKVAKAFNLPIRKLEIDYKEKREIGHILTKEEIDYLRNDVEVMARALTILFVQKMDKMTLGSNALAEYKKLTGSKNFKRYFPTPFYDADIRQAYKGGFTYCDERTQGKDIGDGIVFDVNSLYPSVMYYNKLPYGDGIFFEGEYVQDDFYDLYVQTLTCEFEIKEGYIPTIQIKNNLSFQPNLYIKDSEGEVTLTLTNVDLELFFKHYEVYNITYHSGWKFKSHVGLFKDYIDKWNKIKMESTLNGNEAMRTIAKLMLNNLYGKFALNPRIQAKIPFMENGIIKYKLGEVEEREPIYIPVGCFITAWARHKTISSAQKVYDRFLYADTDSLHLSGTEIPDCLEVDNIKLGAWKHESTFTRARFVRQKTYAEEINGEMHITCAGMPKKCYGHVTWENFKIGTEYGGKLMRKNVKGGIVLLDTTFKIKEH